MTVILLLLCAALDPTLAKRSSTSITSGMSLSGEQAAVKNTETTSSDGPGGFDIWSWLPGKWNKKKDDDVDDDDNDYVEEDNEPDEYCSKFGGVPSTKEYENYNNLFSAAQDCECVAPYELQCPNDVVHPNGFSGRSQMDGRLAYYGGDTEKLNAAGCKCGMPARQCVQVRKSIDGAKTQHEPCSFAFGPQWRQWKVKYEGDDTEYLVDVADASKSENTEPCKRQCHLSWKQPVDDSDRSAEEGEKGEAFVRSSGIDCSEWGCSCQWASDKYCFVGGTSWGKARRKKRVQRWLRLNECQSLPEPDKAGRAPCGCSWKCSCEGTKQYSENSAAGLFYKHNKCDE